MEQFVLVPASVYNNKKSLNTQAVRKKDVPKYQAEKNSLYQTDSLKKEISKASLPKQTLWSAKFCLVLLSSTQTRGLYNWMVWKMEFYCQTLLNIFVVKTQTFQTITSLCSTLLVYLHRWFWSKMPSQSQRHRKLRPLKNLNVRRCKAWTRKVVLIMGLCTI